MPKKPTIGPAAVAAVKSIDFELLAIDRSNVKISQNRLDTWTGEPYVEITLAGVRQGWDELIARITATGITVFGAATTETEVTLINALLALYTDQYSVELHEPRWKRDSKVLLIDAATGADVRSTWESHLGHASGDLRLYRHPLLDATIDREQGLLSYNGTAVGSIAPRRATAR